MPQISQVAATYASQIFWLLLTFGIVFLVIGRGMVPKVQGVVDQRDKSVSDDLAAAEAARKSADAAEETWRQHENAARESAQKLIAEARRTGAAATETRLAQANEKLNADIGAAEARIGESRTAAMAEIENVAAEAAQEIVSRLSSANVSEAEARQAVKAVLHG